MRQEELFPAETLVSAAHLEIPGFRLQPEYLSATEEAELLARIGEGPWQTEFRRRLQLYGLGYGSDRRKPPIWQRDFPDWLMPLAHRVARDAPLERFPENCVINEYIPPLGIGSHKDYDAFGPAIACVSLGSDIVMDFTNPQRTARIAVPVPARSFWVIAGEARWDWEHGIASRLTDVIAGVRRSRGRRVSITFRTGKEPLSGG
jgi:alkylated DNA repair dioxygenase AlkB